MNVVIFDVQSAVWFGLEDASLDEAEGVMEPARCFADFLSGALEGPARSARDPTARVVIERGPRAK